jgi:hypothetical protein
MQRLGFFSQPALSADFNGRWKDFTSLVQAYKMPVSHILVLRPGQDFWLQAAVRSVLASIQHVDPTIDLRSDRCF